MEIKDFKEKKKYAMDFYEQAIEVNDMVHDSIRGFHYLYCYDFYNERDVNNIEMQKLIERRRRQLLIELGRVGEYAIKYLLLMQQINNYPNQSFEEFKNKTLYSIAEKGVRNTYINQYHMDQNTINEILIAKDEHKLQPLHDYSYLFTILEKLFSDVTNHIHENLLFNVKSYYNEENMKLPKGLSSLIAFFSSINFLASSELSEEVRNVYIDEYKEIMAKSGDSFTKLRYLENNIENKQYNIQEIMYLLDQLIDFIDLVHNYNKDNPEKDIRVAYLKKKISEVMLPQGLRKYDEYPGFAEKLQTAENRCKTTFETLDKYPELLETIDYSQLAIWSRFTGSDTIYEEAISNFVNNLIKFKDNEKVLLNNSPLLLPENHILETSSFLQEIGLDLSLIKKDESSILCVPINYLKMAYEGIKGSEVSAKSLISNINKILYYQGMDKSSIPELPLRHR